MEEPGRRIVREELACGGRALPWIDLAAFAQRALEVARADLITAADWAGLVFFDRGIIDAAAALQHATSKPVLSELGTVRPYRSTAFLTPPWPELFASDAERRHGWNEAVAEYSRLQRAYSGLGYRTIILPRISVSERADLVLRTLEALRDGAPGAPEPWG